MGFLEINSNRSQSFNDYLIKKIKADLTQSALSFNPIFLFHSKEYSIKHCINSLYCKKDIITFKEIIPIKHLIYNNRQFFWLNIMNFYSQNLNREYLIWRGKLSNLRTYSRKIK